MYHCQSKTFCNIQNLAQVFVLLYKLSTNYWHCMCHIPAIQNYVDKMGSVIRAAYRPNRSDLVLERARGQWWFYSPTKLEVQSQHLRGAIYCNCSAPPAPIPRIATARGYFAPVCILAAPVLGGGNSGTWGGDNEAPKSEAWRAENRVQRPRRGWGSWGGAAASPLPTS